VRYFVEKKSISDTGFQFSLLACQKSDIQNRKILISDTQEFENSIPDTGPPSGALYIALHTFVAKTKGHIHFENDQHTHVTIIPGL